jgi:hypothetical protein
VERGKDIARAGCTINRWSFLLALAGLATVIATMALFPETMLRDLVLPLFLFPAWIRPGTQALDQPRSAPTTHGTALSQTAEGGT